MQKNLKRKNYHHSFKMPHHPQRKQVIGWLEVTGQIWQFWHSMPFSAKEPFYLPLHKSSTDGCNRNIALLLVLLTFSGKDLMVKNPIENSVPVLKGAALTKLKTGEVPILFGGLISQASCLEGHSFHTVSTRGNRISVACMWTPSPHIQVQIPLNFSLGFS